MEPSQTKHSTTGGKEGRANLSDYKGIYYGDQTQKYQDPVTGAHFEFRDMCRRLEKLFDRQLQSAAVASNFGRNSAMAAKYQSGPAKLPRRDTAKIAAAPRWLGTKREEESLSSHYTTATSVQRTHTRPPAPCPRPDQQYFFAANFI